MFSVGWTTVKTATLCYAVNREPNPYTTATQEEYKMKQENHPLYKVLDADYQIIEGPEKRQIGIRMPRRLAALISSVLRHTGKRQSA